MNDAHLEEAESCFVCFELEDPTNPFTNTLCKCKGSLHLHTKCYIRLRGTYMQCPNCKTPYPLIDLEYEDGLPIQVFTDENGHIHRYTYMDENIPHGKYTIYYPSGTLELLGYYDRGVPCKNTRKWNPNGILCEYYSYLEGKLNSYYYKWDTSGNQTSVTSYYKGMLSGRVYTFIDSNTVKITAYARNKPLKYVQYVNPSTLPHYICVSTSTAESIDCI